MAVSLPLWRAALAGNTYILQAALLPLHGTLAGVAYAAALAGIGLALALGVLPCARRLATGGGALLAPLGLLALAALLFVFQFGSPMARWVAALLAFPAATVTWGALAQRSAGAGSRFLVGWFAGLALDVLLRLAARTADDLIWQAGGDVVVIVMAIAAAVSGVVTWPRGPAFAPPPISPLPGSRSRPPPTWRSPARRARRRWRSRSDGRPPRRR